jgi:replicative DNA helicase
VTDTDRIPPHDTELENAVLASCLVVPESVPTCIQHGLSHDLFYVAQNKLIAKAIVETYTQGKGVDIITVSDTLSASGALEAAGGVSKLGELLEGCRSTPNPKDWITGLIRLATRRRIIHDALNLAARAADDTDTDVESDAGQVMVAATEAHRAGERRLHSAAELIPRFWQQVEAAAQSGGSAGISTGFDVVDAMTGGLFASDLIIVGGRPSMGKTAFGLGMAVAAALSGHRTLFLSLEMSTQQLIQRLVSRIAKVSLYSLRCGTTPTRDYGRMKNATEMIAALPLYIDDTPSITATYAQAVVNTVKPDIVFVDYLQLMRGNVGENARGGSRQQEIGGITRGLKGMAKTANVPVVALAQVGRACEQRGGDRKPLMSDLREAGDIENDADVVMFVYRGEYYFPDKQDLKGIGEIILAKQRNGPTGSDTVGWHKDTASYENLDRTHDDEVWNGGE